MSFLVIDVSSRSANYGVKPRGDRGDRPFIESLGRPTTHFARRQISIVTDIASIARTMSHQCDRKNVIALDDFHKILGVLGQLRLGQIRSEGHMETWVHQPGLFSTVLALGSRLVKFLGSHRAIIHHGRGRPCNSSSPKRREGLTKEGSRSRPLRDPLPEEAGRHVPTQLPA